MREKKQLYSGDNWVALQKEWDNHMKLPFPDSPDDEKLDDLHGDLVLYDAHIAGIVSSLLFSGRKVDKKLVYVDEILNKKLDSFKPSSSKPELFAQWKAVRDYKDEVDKLAKLVLYYY
jgi:uncharacterized protein YhaN